MIRETLFFKSPHEVKQLLLDNQRIKEQRQKYFDSPMDKRLIYKVRARLGVKQQAIT